MTEDCWALRGASLCFVALPRIHLLHQSSFPRKHQWTLSIKVQGTCMPPHTHTALHPITNTRLHHRLEVDHVPHGPCSQKVLLQSNLNLVSVEQGGNEIERVAKVKHNMITINQKAWRKQLASIEGGINPQFLFGRSTNHSEATLGKSNNSPLCAFALWAHH